MAKKRQKKVQKNVGVEQTMETDEAPAEEKQADAASGGEEDESSEGTSEEESEDELMKDDLEGAEVLNFDFEALPLHNNDKEGIINMLTQMFLRADVDVDDLAGTLIQNSPFGCAFLAAEDVADEGSDDVVYGVLSMVPLGSEKKYEKDIWTLLKMRAKKYALDKKMASRLDALSSGGDSRVGLLINERMLHFPAQIAAPSFASLKNDLANGGKTYNFTDVVIIMKVRVADANPESKAAASSGGSGQKGGKRKLGKAAKKRLAAARSGDTIFDNPEEKLLFQEKQEIEFFQYPVQSDVEKDSKFNAVVLNGVTYRPYRRVCIVKREIFDQYVDGVSSATDF